MRAVDAETRRPIPGVFLSLSGQGYRNNTATQADGEQEFLNLPAGAGATEYGFPFWFWNRAAAMASLQPKGTLDGGGAVAPTTTFLHPTPYQFD